MSTFNLNDASRASKGMPDILPTQSIQGGGNVSKPESSVASPSVQPIMGEAAKLTPGEVVEIVQKANEAMKSNDSNLQFVIDPDSGERVVKVIDKETQEVLRQIPSVEMLKIAKAIEKMQGVLMSTQV